MQVLTETPYIHLPSGKNSFQLAALAAAATANAQFYSIYSEPVDPTAAAIINYFEQQRLSDDYYRSRHMTYDPDAYYDPQTQYYQWREHNRQARNSYDNAIVDY